MNAKIYKITNDINSKIYVGQTYKTLNERFDRHCSESKWINTKKMPIVHAIKKYGKCHFKIELLENLPITYSQYEVDKKEIEWGIKLNTMSPTGYNLRLGSSHGKWSDEVKKKIGNSHRGKKASDETRNRLSISHKGYVVSDITKKKLSDRWKGISLPPLAKINSLLATQKTYTLIDPAGKHITITNMAKFCRENGYGKARMCELVKGRIKTYLGWRRCE